MVGLVYALGGRTLGLFSSRRAAERAAEVLRARTDLTILLQGEEPLPLLVRRSGTSATVACSGSCRCGRGSTCPATPASW